MLMSTWLANCTVAVMQFLSIPTNIPFLTSQVNLAEGDEHEDLVQGICAFLLGICIEFNDNSQPSFTKEDLCQLIVKRIGLETFLDKLIAITKNENYSRAAQNPHLKFKQPSEVLFDYEFCRRFKSLEGVIIKAVQPKPKLLNGPESSMTPEQQEVLRQYKDLIREQDQQNYELKSKINVLESEYELAKTQIEDKSSTIQQLKDQNALLKAQRSVSGNSSSQEVLQLKQEIEQLKLELNNKQIEINARNEEISQKEAIGLSLEAQEQFSNAQSNEETLALINNLQTETEAKNKEIEALNEEVRKSRELIQSLQESQKSILDSKESNDKLLEEKSILEEQLNIVRKEQEDMLILLTDQSDKISEYKKRLRDLGQQVEDDEDSITDDSEEFGDDLNDLKYDLSGIKNEPNDDKYD